MMPTLRPPSSNGNGGSSGHRFTDELGDIGRDPRTLWDARLGYFAVRPDEVGDMTPAQLLGCVDVFAAMHGRRWRLTSACRCSTGSAS